MNIKAIAILIAGMALINARQVDEKALNSGQDSKKSINWLTMEEAQKKVKENPKTVFIDVYTDWCGYCKVMDKKTFGDEKVIKYVNENYYAVKLNAESKDTINFHDNKFTKQQFARKLKVKSYPTIVVFNPSFSRFQPIPGYRKPDGFIDVLKKFKKATKNKDS